MVKNKEITLSNYSLSNIRDKALYLYKSNGINPHQGGDAFLAECFSIAVLEELNKNGLTDLIYKRDSLELDKQSIEDM